MSLSTHGFGPSENDLPSVISKSLLRHNGIPCIFVSEQCTSFQVEILKFNYAFSMRQSKRSSRKDLMYFMLVVGLEVWDQTVSGAGT